MTDFGWTQAEAAEHLGLERSSVSNILRLLRLPAIGKEKTLVEVYQEEEAQ